jgi:hypothetical protein
LATIVEEGVVEWHLRDTCSICNSVVDYDAKDLSKKTGRWSSDPRESGADMFYVVCPRCKNRKYITAKSIPEFIKQNATDPTRIDPY